MDSSMETLCDEVLIEVFMHLSAKELKNASLVCKRWNDLIGSSSQLMRNFTWQLQGVYSRRYWKPEFNEIMTLKRRPWEIEVNLSDQTDLELLVQLLERHGSQVRSFSLTSYNVFGFRELAAILRSMPLIEKLHLQVHKSEAKIPDEDLLQLLKPLPKFLRSLSMKTTDWNKIDWNMFELLKVIDPLSIKELYLFNESRSGQPDSVIEFMSAAKNLKILHLNERIFDFVFTEDRNELLSFGFKLTKFKLECEWPDFLRYDIPRCSQDNKVTGKFITFLESQASSLEELDAQYNFQSEVFYVLFTRMRSLKALTIKCNALPKEMDFYESLKPMMKLRVLRTSYQFAEENVKKGILKYCPEVTKYEEGFFYKSIRMSKNPFEGIVEFMSIHNKKLENLTIKSIYSERESNVKFEKLNSVFVHLVEDQNLFMNFIKVNSTVENVSIRFYKGKTLELDDLRSLVAHPSLKKLSMQESDEKIVEIWRLIKNDEALSRSIEDNANEKVLIFKKEK